MRFTVFKLLPLDWSLPVFIINEFNKYVYSGDGTRVLESMEIYKSIGVGLDVVKNYFDILYMIGLIFITTDQIYTAYLGLLKFKYDGEGHTPQMILRNLYSLQNFALLSSPAISAGLVTVVVGDLKLILLERILQERDKDHEVHLQTFLDYVNVRPMQFKVFSVAPLDWSLPILILNLCISYQIIIVQFTKLY
ncbi:uncharacterized protein LOC114351069 [Ostrinia furnacalis]|uniref:uncharacterized protein LOC114351069 n=1 Tax=Ostrinia furnacalis TaxID=93504 RepID=UPI0010409F87|nr:uncharacterized protein LOC114351069 [Ostrinia furnacalis]